MSVSIMNSVSGGGGGISSDEVTAIASDVLKGKTYLGNDTNDEIGTGTLELTGNAAVTDVLKGKTFYNTDAKSIKSGTLELTGDLERSYALAGKTFYSNYPNYKQTGELLADRPYGKKYFYYNRSGDLELNNGSVILIYSNNQLTFNSTMKNLYTIYENKPFNSDWWYGYTLISKTGSPVSNNNYVTAPANTIMLATNLGNSQSATIIS